MCFVKQLIVLVAVAYCLLAEKCDSLAVPASSPASQACTVSKTIRAEPAKDRNARVGQGDWYVNANHTIWVGKQNWRAGDGGNKAFFIRPTGTKLLISGKRLDAPAPPLRASIPCCYPTGFQATGLYFPTPGCWEITATAGTNQLRFIAEVSEAEAISRK